MFFDRMVICEMNIFYLSFLSNKHTPIVFFFFLLLYVLGSVTKPIQQLLTIPSIYLCPPFLKNNCAFYKNLDFCFKKHLFLIYFKSNFKIYILKIFFNGNNSVYFENIIVYNPNSCLGSWRQGISWGIYWRKSNWKSWGWIKKEVEFPGQGYSRKTHVEFPWVLVFDLEIFKKGCHTITQFCRIFRVKAFFSRAVTNLKVLDS